MSLKSDLVAAKALIDMPQKWRKGALHGHGRYCALGACEAVAPGLTDRTYLMLRALGNANTSDKLIFVFNDDPSTTHPDIMALFDRAINAASIASLDAAIAECAKPLPRHA